MSLAVTELDRNERLQLLETGYDRYLRMHEGPARLILRDVMAETEEVVEDPDSFTATEIGSTALRTTIDTVLLEAYDQEPDEEQEAFIGLFESAMDAFYPEGISYASRMELYDLSRQARQPANGDKTRNDTIYEARHSLLRELVCKDKDESKHYRRINVDNLFSLAVWLRGGSAEEVNSRGWSVSPKQVFQQNVPLIQFSIERLDTASRGLAELVGCKQSKILESAARAITRYDAQEQTVRDQAERMRTMGSKGILRHAAIRPDIMCFPIDIIEAQEQELVDMGFELDDIRADYKLYVYNPARIAGRLTWFDTLTRAAVPELPQAEADEVVKRTHQEVVSKTQLVVNNSEGKLEKYTELVKTYSTVEAWQEALDTAHAQAKLAPRQAAINNLLRANYDELKASMEANPSQNIFLVARELVNRKARQRYAEKIGKLA